MKIYTGTGDKGKTSLFSGERVPKHHYRVEAYGVIDELSAHLGVLSAALPDAAAEAAEAIGRIQGDLLTVGALLATTPGAPAFSRLPQLTQERIAWLEAAIDAMEAHLPPLKHFLLPGGHPAAAYAHVARTVCRRAERRMAAVIDDAAPAGGADHLRNAAVFVNRLSDFLFVLARECNRVAGMEETPWHG